LPLFLVIALISLAHCAMTSTRVVVSLFALQLQASNFTVGVLIGLFGLCPMLFAVTVGRLVDRYGARWPVRVGAVMLLAGCAIPWFMPNIGALFVASTLIGAGFVSLHVAGQHVVGRLSTPETRTRDFGYLSIGYSTSSFLGPMTAGFAIDLIGHHKTFLLFAGVAAVVMVTALSGRVPLPPAIVRSETHVKGNLLDLVKPVDMRAIYVVGILLAAAWDLFVYIVPVQGTHLGFSASTIGIILGAFAAATFAIRVVMPWLSRRFREWQLLRGAMYLAGASYLVFPFLTSVSSWMICAIFLGLAVGAAQPNLLSLLHTAAPPGRGGEAVGLRVTITNFGQVTLPLFSGAVGTAVGIVPVFWIIALGILAGIPMANRQAHAAIPRALADIPVMPPDYPVEPQQAAPEQPQPPRQ